MKGVCEKVDFSGKNQRKQLCPPFLKKHPLSPYRGDNTPTIPPYTPYKSPTNAPNAPKVHHIQTDLAFVYGLKNTN